MVGVLLLVGASVAATCGEWSPGVHTDPNTRVESAAIAVTWTNAGPVACSNLSGDDWSGTDHLRLRRASGTTPPGTPSSGTQVANLSPTATSKDDFIHRSDATYSHALFACEDSSCTSWYGDGSGDLESTSETEDSDSTEKELWLLEGVADEAAVGTNVVGNNKANAPHAFYYPSSWSTGYSEKLGLYWSKSATPGGAASEVYHRNLTSTGWPAGGFNTTTAWSSDTLVLEGSTDSSEDDYKADHPWAMLTQDGSDKRVQLFVHSQDVDNKQIIQIESTDASGTDFDLDCSGAACTHTALEQDGYVAVAADGTSSTDYVVHAQHSRVAWDYIDDPVIDAGTDQPWMMFQVKRPSADDCADTGGYDDIGWVDATWDSTNSVWDWAVETDLSTPACPVIHVNDAHDNSSVPLPNNEFKMYFKDWSSETWYVSYWDGSAWGDSATIEFEFDSSTTSHPTHDCIENVAVLVYADPPVVEEGMFFRLLDTNACPNSGTGGSVGFDNVITVDEGAIVFAKHVN